MEALMETGKTGSPPKIGQFTITMINNGWLVRWDMFRPDLQMSVPNIQHHDTLEDCFATIKTMDPKRVEPKIKLATNMPTVTPPVVKK